MEELSGIIAKLIKIIADDIVEELQSRYKTMIEEFRSASNVHLRGLISEAGELKDELSLTPDLQNKAESIKTDLVEFRSELLELQEAVENNAENWNYNIRKGILVKIADKLRQTLNAEGDVLEMLEGEGVKKLSEEE